MKLRDFTAPLLIAVMAAGWGLVGGMIGWRLMEGAAHERLVAVVEQRRAADQQVVRMVSAFIKGLDATARAVRLADQHYAPHPPDPPPMPAR